MWCFNEPDLCDASTLLFRCWKCTAASTSNRRSRRTRVPTKWNQSPLQSKTFKILFKVCLFYYRTNFTMKLGYSKCWLELNFSSPKLFQRDKLKGNYQGKLILQKPGRRISNCEYSECPLLRWTRSSRSSSSKSFSKDSETCWLIPKRRCANGPEQAQPYNEKQLYCIVDLFFDQAHLT